MSTPLHRRLAALEAVASRARSEDSPEARAAAAYLGELFDQHDADGVLLSAYNAASDPAARAVVVVDLLDRAGTAAEREFLNLLAAAEGRQPCPLNP